VIATAKNKIINFINLLLSYTGLNRIDSVQFGLLYCHRYQRVLFINEELCSGKDRNTRCYDRLLSLGH